MCNLRGVFVQASELWNVMYRDYIKLIIRCFTVGEYNLRLGITKELHPEMIATHQGAHCCWTLQAP